MRKPLLLITLLAVILRLAVAFALGDSAQVLPGIYDQVSYHNLALRLIAGHGFTFAETWWPITPAGQPTAHWSYLYTFYLAAVYTLFGPHPLAARLIQAALAGVLLPLLTHRLTLRLLTPNPDRVAQAADAPRQAAALIAAAWAAFYPYFLYYNAALLTETFYILAILAALLLTLDLARPNPQSSILNPKFFTLGLLLALAVLLRQLFLLFIPFLCLWFLFARLRYAARDSKLDPRSPDTGPLTGSPASNLPTFQPSSVQTFLRSSLSLIPTLLTLAALILPFTLFNYRQFGRFVLLNTNAGYAFFWGNHPVYGDTFVPILTPDMPTYQELIPPELRGLDEAALDQALLKAGLGFVFADPARYLRLSLSRLPAYFWFWPSPQSSLPSNLTRVASLGLALPFMLAGIFLWLLRVWNVKRSNLLTFQREPDPYPGLLLLTFVFVYTLIHLLSWALVRYRLPVDAVLLPFAAFALSTLIERLPKQLVSKIKLESQ